MKKALMIPLLGLGLWGCSGVEKPSSNNEAAVQLIENAQGHQVYTLDFSKVNDDNDVLMMPLSYFIDDLKVVPLETKENAFVEPKTTLITDNYIGVSAVWNRTYKLFDHNGKYIRDIGKTGKGPGEYQALTCEYIDEANNRIYMYDLLKNSSIIVYDTLGELQAPVPLQYPGGQKLHFAVNDNLISIMNSPLPNDKYVAYQQDTEGNVKHTVAKRELGIKPGFASAGRESFLNTADVDFQIVNFVPDQQDTLYHYSTTEDHLIPVFTTKFQEEEPPTHRYIELKNGFILEIRERKDLGGGRRGTINPRFFFISKKDLSVQKIQIKNNFLGNIDAEPDFEGGKYVYNATAKDLKEQLTAALEDKTLGRDMRKKIKALNNQLTNSDNTVVLWGKLK